MGIGGEIAIELAEFLKALQQLDTDEIEAEIPIALSRRRTEEHKIEYVIIIPENIPRLQDAPAILRIKFKKIKP